MILIINMRLINNLDHKLGAHKNIDLYAGVLYIFISFLKIYEDLRYKLSIFEIIGSKEKINGSYYKFGSTKSTKNVVEGIQFCNLHKA